MSTSPDPSPESTPDPDVPRPDVPRFPDRETLARVARAVVDVQDALDGLVRDLATAAGLDLADPRTRQRLAEAVHEERVRREMDAMVWGWPT